MVSEHYEWLPASEPLGSHDGDWTRYLNAIYKIFEQDFVVEKPVFRGKRLGLKRYPLYDNKEGTFWHFISEGNVEADRIPDLRRCERIRWPKPSINLCDSRGVLVWQEEKGNESRIHIYLEHEAYLVVLNERKDYILPWTAYYVDREHQRSKLVKRHASWLKHQHKS